MRWRLLPYAEFDGATNMAIDEAILEACIAGESPPTLRVYGFVPPAITIGLSQNFEPELARSIKAEGIDVVRRPTGGRAVLHLNDLTYAFIGCDNSQPNGFLSTSVTDSYKEISQGLINAFAALGVQSEFGATGVAYRHLADCFMATTGSDLHHQGTKLIGSAQVRRRGWVLQHGSVPLNQDPLLMPSLLGEPAGQTARHLNLFDLIGAAVDFSRLQGAFETGFRSAFGVELESGELNTFELSFVKSKLQQMPESVLA